MEILLVSLVLIVSVALLVSEKLPIDLTALGIMAALMVLGILGPREALAGFANPGPLTIAALFIVSRGLISTGALDFLTHYIMAFTKGRRRPLLFLLLALAGAFSSFINNTPVVVLFIPILMGICGRYGMRPSKFLLPISYVSILAGTTTLIGTSTNIIVSDLSAQMGHGHIGMFELTRLGFPIAITGAAYLFLFSNRILPDHKAPLLEKRNKQDQHYISELVIPEGSPLIGQNPVNGLGKGYDDIETYEVIRGFQVLEVGWDPCTIQEGDMLLVKASASDLVQILKEKSVVLPKEGGETLPLPHDPESLVVELLVPPNSRYEGRRLRNTPLHWESHIHVLGIKRRGVHYAMQKQSRLQLTTGDVLLVQAPGDHLEGFRADGELIVLEDVIDTLVNRKKAPVATGLFLAMVIAATFGLADILVCSVTAAFLMLLFQCLSMRAAYASLDVRVLLLIIGTLALGRALDKTGASDLYAKGFLSLFQGMPPWVVLSAVIALTSLLSHFISNNSTAVLLLPVGISTATALGVDPRPFIIGICFGASACFATSIGYQTNLLVYGPGRYRFSDYLRLGIPLNILVWGASSLFIPFLWPF